MRVRPYENKDRAQIEAICLGKTQAESPMEEALKTVFASFYLEQYPHDAFVIDKEGEAKGYILSAPSYQDYLKKVEFFCSKFQSNSYVKAIFEGCSNALAPFQKEYPAHFHIDLDPSIQRKGYGSSLLSILEEHLLEQGCNGLMLNVAIQNQSAISFYQKNGYDELARDGNQIAMGKHLGDQK